MGKKFNVFDTKKENDLIVQNLLDLPKNSRQTFHCVVDSEKRRAIANNHSATHLLHAALKQVLGNHVVQKGSLVNAHLLRFDFSHFTKMTEEEVTRVEKIVNQKIRQNIALDEQRNVPIAKAKKWVLLHFLAKNMAILSVSSPLIRATLSSYAVVHT